MHCRFKDAYYSVKLKDEFQCYLKFQWKQNLLKFVSFPNGLGPCPRKFTKISNTPTSDLRLRGVPVSGVIDAFSYSQCEKNVHDVIMTFIRLGFTIHPTKPQLVPKQEMASLGFVIYSRAMTTSSTANKHISKSTSQKNHLKAFKNKKTNH